MAFFSNIAENLDLMQTMFKQTGAIQQPPGDNFQASSLRQAVQRCASCSKTDACRNWLSLGKENNLADRTPPGFCPNSDLQKEMKIAR